MCETVLCGDMELSHRSISISNSLGMGDMYCATKPSQAIVWVFSKAVRQSLGGKPEMRVWLTLIEGADVFAEAPEGVQAA